MSYEQYINVLIDYGLLDDYGTLNNYETALKMYNTDEELREEYSNCFEWFKVYVREMVIDGI